MQGVAIAQVTPSPYKIAGRLAEEFADTASRRESWSTSQLRDDEGYITAKVIVKAVRRFHGSAIAPNKPADI